MGLTKGFYGVYELVFVFIRTFGFSWDLTTLRMTVKDDGTSWMVTDTEPQ